MSARDVILIAVVVFVSAIVFMSVKYVTNIAYDEMKDNPVINDSDTTVEVLSAGQAISERLDYVIFAVFIALVLGLIITGWFIGGNPLFMFLYFFFIVIAVIISVLLSNGYETIIDNSILSTQVSSFTITNQMVLNLPIIIAVVGFLGIVVMFAKPFVGGEGV